MLWTLISVLFVVWLLGLVLHFGGGLIHLAIVAAVVLLIVRLVTGRPVT